LNLSCIDADLNTIDSHETDRIASMCVNRALPYDEWNSPLKNKDYKVRKPNADERALQKLLVLLQLTYLGSPVIYYGDESGMWGGDDPDCRKPMLWSDKQFYPENSMIVNGDTANYPVNFDSSMFAFYSTLLKLRTEHISLRTGNMQSLVLDDVSFIYAYQRESGADKVFIVINASDKPQECRIPLAGILDGTRIEDPLCGVYFYAKKDGISLVLPANTGTVLIPKH
jgi:cyclomaltodextrinase / maltogenic alpha-amylase / neopullulanase